MAGAERHPLGAGVLESQRVGGGRQVAAVVEIKIVGRLGVGGKVDGGGAGRVLHGLLHVGGNLLLNVVHRHRHLVDALLHAVLLVLHRGGVERRNGLRGIPLLQGGAGVGVGEGVGAGTGHDLSRRRLLGLIAGWRGFLRVDVLVLLSDLVKQNKSFINWLNFTWHQCCMNLKLINSNFKVEIVHLYTIVQIDLCLTKKCETYFILI